jgi:hypothetical protein
MDQSSINKFNVKKIFSNKVSFFQHNLNVKLGVEGNQLMLSNFIIPDDGSNVLSLSISPIDYLTGKDLYLLFGYMKKINDEKAVVTVDNNYIVSIIDVIEYTKVKIEEIKQSMLESNRLLSNSDQEHCALNCDTVGVPFNKTTEYGDFHCVFVLSGDPSVPITSLIDLEKVIISITPMDSDSIDNVPPRDMHSNDNDDAFSNDNDDNNDSD